jgi:orotate phosphoribosyltransferase
MNDLNNKTEFIRFAIASGVLKFGQFQTKAGRQSPYFFNTGLFADGAGFAKMCEFYADTLIAYEAQNNTRFDMLFGPAYKGITLAAGTAIALAQRGRNLPFCFNRKEAKDHGEGGLLVGAPLQGKVVIVDDVISAGTSVRQAVNWILEAGAKPAAVLISLDRMERGGTADAPTNTSAVQEVQRDFGIPVIAGFNLNDLMAFLQSESSGSALSIYRDEVANYRARYGLS